MKKIIIIDFNRTLYDPEQERIMDETIDTLKYLKSKNYKLVLLSMAHPNRKKLLDSLGITPFFNKIIITNYKSKKLFNKIINNSESVVIGDRIKKEITIGNQVNATTIWLQQGKFANELPTKNIEKPNYIIKKIEEIKKILN